MKILASRIKRQLEGQVGRWEHCAIYENELQRLWPLDEKNRKAKIAAFAKEYGFRLSVYRPGLCAIFEEGLNDAAPISSTSIQDGKYSGYRIQSTLDRIEIALATAHRWQTIAKLRWQMVAKLLGVLLRRVASQTTMAFLHCYTSLESRSIHRKVFSGSVNMGIIRNGADGIQRHSLVSAGGLRKRVVS
jgi:hypothetical protein